MWQQGMRIGCATQVSISHGIQNSRDQDSVQEYLSALQLQCASRFCELSMNTHQNADGRVATTVLTTLPKAEVSALTVRQLPQSLDLLVSVGFVELQAVMSINGAIATHWN
jgi:hypothetical protein